MQPHDNPPPPRWVDRFLERFCAPHLREEVLGDLHERYHRDVRRLGARQARRRYPREGLSYLRFSVFKRPKARHPQPLPFDMIRNYLTIAFRNLQKQKRFAVLNLAGLTLGITGALVILLIVQFERSYDTFHPEAGRLYRVLSGTPGQADNPGTPHGLRGVLEREFAEVEKTAAAFKLNPERTQLEIDHQLTREPYVCFVTPSFFELFAFRWLQGSPQTSLSEPGQVVIDEEMARKYFRGNPLGQRVRLDNEHDLVVSGVIAKMPANTDFPIQFAVSHRTFEQTKGYEATYSAGSNSSYQAFVLLREKADPAALEKKFPAMIARHLGREQAEKYMAHGLQPLSRVHFDEVPGRQNFSKRFAAHSNLTGLAWIGAFLLLTACINFINLATAQATQRAREVGIRKVLGSTRGQLVVQFMGETLLLTLAAVVLSGLLTHQAVRLLDGYLGIPLDVAAVFTPGNLLVLAGAGVAVGLAAGIYPSLVLSAFEPVRTLKNTLAGSSPGGNRLRKGLVAFQFGIAQLMIICTVVVVSQMHHVNNTSLGFDKEAVVTVDLPESDPQKLEVLRNQLSQYAAIRAFSFSLNPPAATINKWWNDVTHVSAPGEQIHVEQKFIDEHYLPVYNLRLAAGRNIRRTDTTQIVVNEALLRKINIPNPQAALGQQLTYWGRPVTIVGVVRDFHNLSLHREIAPVLLWRNPALFQKASFKIALGQAPEAVARIERHWKAAFPNHYFSYKFLDDDLATLYEKERKTARLLTLFAGMAIFIGCLGLYGLVSFSAARRTKEVGIRKVLGASVAHIVYLFTRDFVGLLALAFLAAAPLGYYLMRGWLSDFTYQVSLAWWMFAGAGGLAAAIALLTMSFQSVRAALANPVTSLRNE